MEEEAMAKDDDEKRGQQGVISNAAARGVNDGPAEHEGGGATGGEGNVADMDGRVDTSATTPAIDRDEAAAFARWQSSLAADAKAARRERRNEWGDSLGNLLRATGNLVGVGKGGLNTYDSDKATARADKYAERYQKLAAQRQASNDALFNYYQKLKSGNAKAANAKALTDSQVALNAAQTALTDKRAKTEDSKKDLTDAQRKKVEGDTANAASKTEQSNRESNSRIGKNNAAKEKIKAGAAQMQNGGGATPPSDNGKEKLFD